MDRHANLQRPSSCYEAQERSRREALGLWLVEKLKKRIFTANPNLAVPKGDGALNSIVLVVLVPDCTMLGKLKNL